MEASAGKRKFSRKPTKTVIKLGLAALAAGLLLAAGLIAYGQWKKANTIIPADIKKQVPYTIFWPSQDSPIVGDKNTIKYNSENQLLSYMARTKDGTQITVSEQTAPEAFNDVPQAYTKFADDLQQYGSFENDTGKVYLTHPKELKGGQTAVMNTKSALVFMRPNQDVSDDTWKQIFNNLKVVH